MAGEFNFFMPIAKVDKKKDGTCVVTGYASTPTEDSDGEIVTLDAIKAALPDYMQWRNIREMHQLKAVGTAQEANIDTKGLFLRARISDPIAVKKCEEEVYKGFSIGGRKLKKEGNQIIAIDMTEISVVDRPANPDCKIALAKSAKTKSETDGGYLTKAKPDAIPAAHDGLSLPAPKRAAEDQGDMGEAAKGSEGEKCAAHGIVGCEKCAKAEKRDFSAKEREAAAESGAAMPDGSFPIKNAEDLANAIRLAGHAKNPKAARAHIKARAKALGLSDKIPESWSKSQSAKKMVKAQISAALSIAAEPSFLTLKKYVAPVAEDGEALIEPQAPALAKGMGTAGQLAYCFDSIRSAQRSLLIEAKREGGDMKDKALAKELGSIAQRLAGVIGQKADHEGGEATDLSDVDDQFTLDMLGEDFDMDKVSQNVGGSGDPLADAVLSLMKRAAAPSKTQRMSMADGECAKARKACKEAMKAIKAAHKMHKAAYLSKMAKAAKKDKPDDKDGDDEFDHQGAMEKLNKAFDEVSKARTFGKAAREQIAKASARSGQRGEEVSDSEPGVYEVPAGIRDLSPSAMASASPGGMGSGSQPVIYPTDTPYPGKAAGSDGDLRKYQRRDGSIDPNVAELLMEKARRDGELEALRKTQTGGRRPYAFDTTKIVAGGGGANQNDLNKAVFDGVNVSAIGSGDERAHVAASARMIGNLLTTTQLGKSVFDPTFKGAAGASR